MAPYIDQNTKQRAVTDDPFKNNFLKLLKNAFYARTTDNVLSKMRVKNTGDDNVTKKSNDRKNFDSVKSYKDFVVHNFRKKDLKFDRPDYLGFTLIDPSEQFSYETYSDIVQPLFDPKM